jgi:F0F1-type ATP synthase epsilon subunit
VTDGLLFVVRTPHREELSATFDSLRFPTETGQVGVLARAEPNVLAVEPGLVLARRGERITLVATAGGLAHVQAHEVTLLSPFAIVGETGEEVRHALDALMGAPSAEMELRRRIDSLERGLMTESRRRTRRSQERLP